MNVSNGTPGMNTNENSGFNTQSNQSIQRPQQSMNNTQQPNLSKPNNQMGYQQAGMGNMQQTQQMGYQQNQQMNYGQQGYQQNQQMGYQQPMGQMGYQQPVYPVTPAKSVLGLVGLILSIVSLICCGPVLAIPGLICSSIALTKSRYDKKALIGIIISIISILIWVVLFVTGIVSFNKLEFSGIDDIEYNIISESDSIELEDDSELLIEESLDEDETTSVDEDYTTSVDEDYTTSESDIVDNIDTDIDDGEFHPRKVVYDGITLEMGAVTATELETILGCQFDTDDMEYVLNPGYYIYTTYWVEKDPYDRIIYFYFYNDTDSAIPMSQCKLFRVTFYSANYFSGDTLADWANIKLGSGITTSSTIDDILSILGEPDYSYDDEEYQVKSLEYYKIYDYEYRADFDFRDGKLYEISVGLY